MVRPGWVLSMAEIAAGATCFDVGLETASFGWRVIGVSLAVAGAATALMLWLYDRTERQP